MEFISQVYNYITKMKDNCDKSIEQNGCLGKGDGFYVLNGEFIFYSNRSTPLENLQIEEKELDIDQEEPMALEDEELTLNELSETNTNSNLCLTIKKKKRKGQNYVRQLLRKLIDAVQKALPIQPFFKLSRKPSLLGDIRYLFFILRKLSLPLRQKILISVQSQFLEMEEKGDQESEKCLRLISALREMEENDFIDNSKIQSSLRIIQLAGQDRKSRCLPSKCRQQQYLEFENQQPKFV